MNIEKNSLVILLGSHMKIISADCDGKYRAAATQILKYL